MNQYIKSAIVGLVFGCVFCASLLGIRWYFGPASSLILQLDTLELRHFDLLGNVTCSSNSMGLTVRCGDLLYKRNISEYDGLQIGGIYTFRRGNISVVHRLVGCVDLACNLTIFKGDANTAAEFVDRSDITHKVSMVEYAR